MYKSEKNSDALSTRLRQVLSPRGILFPTLLALFAISLMQLTATAATRPSLIKSTVDTSQVATLAAHHPLWATSANLTAALPGDETVDGLTIVLNRPANLQADFEQLLRDQQTPGSANYHKWLTADEIGSRFGVSDEDIAALTNWLVSEGLHVNYIASNRTSINFGGSAANLSRALQTSLNYYTVSGKKMLSVSSDPTIPQAIAPAIRSIRGLFTIPEHPMHVSSLVNPLSPQYTSASSGNHYLTPADFNTIYDVPATYTGAGITIGIVSWARVYTGDLDAFRTQTGVSFPNPTVVIPTAYNGVDPGTPYSTNPGTSVDIGGQEEATLDVVRAGATAPGANLLLVAAQDTRASNWGIGADAEYLILTSPAPAQIISISFGSCESSAGSIGVSFWDNLFSTAAAEGISVFVSSGDSAAAGCITAFSASSLPGTLTSNSPNYICSSQYATCVGGTQFNDTTSPSTYWNSSNSTGWKSAISYIPEGAWNESTTSGGVAGTGGGVSTVIATPSWQNVTGVPSARSGRYTPDISFSSAGHDAYYACMAAYGNGASCTNTANPGPFVGFSGTSAAAPGMAGIAALLDQKLGGGQGNLNPALYSKYVSAPSAFHDVTVASSGVSNCSASTVSICNNSVYYSTGGGVQPGFVVTTGYDEATGLGSLDVANFLNAFSLTATPTVTITPSATSITTAQSLTVPVAVTGTSGTPTGTVALLNGSTVLSSKTLSSGSATFTVAAGALAAGSASLTATYTPDGNSSSTYGMATSAASTVTVSKATPAVTITSVASSVNTNQSLSVAVSVSAGASTATATGTVNILNSSTQVGSGTLSGGTVTVTLAAGSLVSGTASLTAVYVPDTSGATIYNGATSAASSVTVSKVAPTVTLTPASTTLTTVQPLSVPVSVSAGTSAAAATGTVTLTRGSYTSSAATLSSGTATILIPAATLSSGTANLTASYTPDTAGATLYTAASSSAVSVTVNTAAPTVTVTPAYSSIVPGQALTVSMSVSGGTGTPTATGTVSLSSGTYTASATLSSGSASITIPASTFAASTPTLSVSYVPDTASSAIYRNASGSAAITVAKVTPTVTASPSPASITTLQPTTVTVSVTGNSGNPTPTGSITLTSGSYTSTATPLSSGSAAITIPAGSLASGSSSITATYTPDATVSGSASFNPNTGSASVSVGTIAPTLTVSASPSTLTTLQTTTVTISASGGSGNPTVTGTVKLSSGSYTSADTSLSSGSATITIPAGSLSAGTATLTATYTPDTTSAANYKTSTGTATVTVNKTTPVITITAAPTSISTVQLTTVYVSLSGGSGAPTATGTVTLTSGSYTSAATSLSSGGATIVIPAGALTAGTPTVTVTYTPDTAGAANYNTATGTTSITVTKTTPLVTITPASSSIFINQSLSVLVSISGGGNTPASGTVVLSSGSYASSAATLSGGNATITIPAASLAAGSSTALAVVYTPDTAGSALYNPVSGSSSVTVTTLSITSGPITLGMTKGGSGTATFTVAPAYGFQGAVTLTAAITTSPAGAQYAPTLSFGSTSPFTITGTSSATATLTVTTTAASTAANQLPARPESHWPYAGGAVLAGLLFFVLPARRRTWRNLVGLLFLAATLLAGTSGCGGTSTSGSGGTTIAGTTAGAYTITVYGNGYALGTITLNVQ